MKKIFTLFLMPLALASSVTAADGKYVPQVTKEITENTVIYAEQIDAAITDNEGWVTVPNYTLKTNQKYDNVANDSKLTPTPAEDNIENSSSPKTIQIKGVISDFNNNGRIVHINAIGMTEIIAHGRVGSSNNGFTISCTPYEEDNTVNITTDEKLTAKVVRSSNSGSVLVNISDLDPNVNYIVSIQTTGSDGYFYCAEFIAGEMTPAEAFAPEFTVSATELTTIESAQISVAGKKDLDGVTLTNITYTNEGVVTVADDGTVTAVGEGSTTVSFTSTPVDDKYLESKGEFTFTVTKPVVATPVINPTNRMFTESVTVTADCATEGATLSYTINDGQNWDVLSADGVTLTETTTITVKASLEGYTSSEATATFTLFVPKSLSDLVPVTTATTWDWSKFGSTHNGKELTDATLPKKDTDWFVLSDIVGYGHHDAISEDFGNADQLYMCAQYAYRNANSAEFYQGNCIVFNAEVDGKVTVTYANTSNNNPRCVSINEKPYGEETSKNTEYKTATAEVKKGYVIISGYDQTDTEIAVAAAFNEESDIFNPTVKRQYLRISSISFEVDDISSALNIIEADDEAGDAAVYDLLGRRVQNPAKGIYIVNGKKVLVK